MIHGIPIIEHLVSRLIKSNIKIVIAIPVEDIKEYQFLKEKYGVILETGHSNDPLSRMNMAAETHGVEHIIRVSHDKVFVDSEVILNACSEYLKNSVDYLYSSKITQGAGFEIISKSVLKKAADKYKNVEHVSYAIKSVTTNTLDYSPSSYFVSNYRLLIDYPEDIKLIELIMSTIGKDASLKEILVWLHSNKWAIELNKLPIVTIYTCMYNSEKYIEKCIDSVLMQLDFPRYEYIIVDDASEDKSLLKASQMTINYKNVSWIRNHTNLGLASSSNVALKNAKGKYIIRIDSDDFFVRRDSVKLMLNSICERDIEALYPNNYFGEITTVQYGKDSHHIGGSMFKTSAINHIKFTDGLRGFEGLDFFQRAKDSLKIGYFNRPTFFYRQRPDSLSKINLAYREEVKKRLDAQNNHNNLP